MKLFNTLNMRTSELEKSQAQLEMIYENSLCSRHSGAGRRGARGQRIMGTTLGYSTMS
jgi:hypothetical protein